MAEIVFPADASVVALSINLFRPGEIQHTSPYTGGSVIISRGWARWRGEATLGEESPGSAAHARIERFFASLRGTLNTFDIPLAPRPSAEGVASIVATTAAGVFEVDAAPAGWATDRWVRAGDRTYIIRAWDATSRLVRLTPEFPIPEGTSIGPGRGVRARMLETDYASPMTADFAGPWSIDFQEAV